MNASADTRELFGIEGTLQFMSSVLSHQCPPFRSCSKLTVFSPPAQQQGLLVDIHGQYGGAQLLKQIHVCFFFSITVAGSSSRSSNSVNLRFTLLDDVSAYKRVWGTLSQSRAKPSQLRGLSPPEDGGAGWTQAEGGERWGGGPC